jgi:hypothetical protein
MDAGLTAIAMQGKILMPGMSRIVIPFTAAFICHGLVVLILVRRITNNTLTAHSFALIFAVGESLTIFVLASLGIAVARIPLDTTSVGLMAGVPMLNLILGYPVALVMYKYLFRHLQERVSRSRNS